jgi:peptidoglycan/LPS O-acetylase OafA/YrhL
VTLPVTSRVRIDIQVLRAVAVLAVILGHFWPNRFPGGFTGVDVFFVISGYLITAHMVSEVARSGRLNLVDFWMRRVRRILPAALSVIVVITISVLIIGSPSQIDILGRHVIASSLSAENLLLVWDAVDYNHQDDSTSPLQHYWSLAVEEQFYVVWPIVVAGTLGLATFARISGEMYRKLLLVTLALIVIGSFVYAATRDLSNPSTYFDPFARAWELGIGAIIAVAGWSGKWAPRRWIRVTTNLVAWGIIISVIFVPGLDESTPGFGVLSSVLATGAVIVIAAHMTDIRPALAQRTISALVWVGDRSFSAYLWHWPILILAPLALGEELTTAHKVIAIVVVVAVSAASFRFIEQPFRFSASPLIRRPQFLAPLAGAATAMVIVGAIVGVSSTTRSLELADVDSIVPTTTYQAPANGSSDYPYVPAFCNGAGAAVFDCSKTTTVEFGVETLPKFPPITPTCVEKGEVGNFFDCRLGAVDGTKSIAVVGDSHAKALWVAWDDLGKRLNTSVHAFFTDGCPYMRERGDKCDVANESIRGYLIDGSFEFVVLAQSVDHKWRIPDDIEQVGFSATYVDLIEHDVNFVVLKDSPGIGKSERSCFERNFRNPSECWIEREEAFAFRDFAFEAAVSLGVNTMDFSDIYCDDLKCPLAIGNVQVFRDYSHITTIFGKTLGPFIYNELIEQGFVTAE